MREQPKREWPTGAKKEWSTPKVREIPLTDDVLAHFERLESPPLTESEPAKKLAARR